MSDLPRPGGYIDRGLLADAQRASRQVAQKARTLIDSWDQIGRSQRLLLLAQMGLSLAELTKALGEMELLRERWVKRGKKAGAESVGERAGNGVRGEHVADIGDGVSMAGDESVF